MAKTTTGQLIVKTPQWVAESTEGTTPTASPSFTALGAVKSIALKINGNFVDISQVGSEDLITILQGQQEYESQFTLSIVNITGLLDRLFDSANFGTPAGTVNESISIVFSIYLDGTENYIFLRGSRIKEGSVTMEVGKETEVSVTFTHTSISTPGTSHGLTTPTFASIPSGAVWGWTDGGTAPVNWNGGIDCKKITVNISRNTKPDWTLGNLDPHSSQSHGRRISGDFTVLWTANTLETDFKAGTARTLTITLKTSTGVITISNAKIVDYSRDTGADDEDAVVEQCTFRALTVAVAAS